MTITGIAEIVALVLSIVLLVIVFRKNDRKILLAAWMCLLVSLLFGSFIQGVVDGWNAAGDG